MDIGYQAYKPTKNEFNYPFFLLLTDEQKSLILSNSTIVHYEPKEVIFKQDTRTAHIMYVTSGLVKIFKEKKPDVTLLLKFICANNFLGLITYFGSELYQFSATAIVPSDILCIDSLFFKDILRENHNFTVNILNQVSQDALYIFNKLLKHIHKQLPGRVADVLLYFSEEIYHSETFIFPVTRKELAEFAGTTKESFIRTLTEFKNDKIIDLDGSKVTINSMKIVQKLSNIG